MSFFFNINYRFSVVGMLSLKSKFAHKLVFNKKHTFLKRRSMPVQSLSCRFMNRGNFLKIYKQLNYLYYKSFLRTKLKTIPVSSNFLFFFKKYDSFKSFDKTLFWRINQLDCIFSHKHNASKKQKISSLNLKYISGVKRLLLCLNFLKYVILLSVSRKKKNLSYKLWDPLLKYITNEKDNLPLTLKHKVYRYKLSLGTY